MYKIFRPFSPAILPHSAYTICCIFINFAAFCPAILLHVLQPSMSICFDLPRLCLGGGPGGSGSGSSNNESCEHGIWKCGCASFPYPSVQKELVPQVSPPVSVTGVDQPRGVRSNSWAQQLRGVLMCPPGRDPSVARQRRGVLTSHGGHPRRVTDLQHLPMDLVLRREIIQSCK